MRAILTVTLNPAFDRTVWLDTFAIGATNRAVTSGVRVGGKGINVARAVASQGVTAFAVGIAGRDQAGALERALKADGVIARFTRIVGETRTNLKLIERVHGGMTEVNEPGPAVDDEALGALEAEILDTVERDDIGVVVMAGSLPAGVAPTIYADWTRRLSAATHAPAVLVDASDEALAAAVAARPFLVKPNRVEAETLLGRPIPDRDAALLAATAIIRRGPRAVLLSLGSDGAVAALGDTAERIDPQMIEVGGGRLTTTVGAGDAMVARIAVGLVRRGGTPRDMEAAEFVELCRLAVTAASEQIRGGA